MRSPRKCRAGPPRTPQPLRRGATSWTLTCKRIRPPFGLTHTPRLSRPRSREPLAGSRASSAFSGLHLRGLHPSKRFLCFPSGARGLLLGQAQLPTGAAVIGALFRPPARQDPTGVGPGPYLVRPPSCEVARRATESGRGSVTGVRNAAHEGGPRTPSGGAASLGSRLPALGGLASAPVAPGAATAGISRGLRTCWGSRPAALRRQQTPSGDGPVPAGDPLFSREEPREPGELETRAPTRRLREALCGV